MIDAEIETRLRSEPSEERVGVTGKLGRAVNGSRGNKNYDTNTRLIPISSTGECHEQVYLPRASDMGC